MHRETSLQADTVAEPAVDPVEPFERRLPQALTAALAALPDKQREAVELIHIAGLSVAQAAKRAGVTKSALKVRAHRGYRSMRASLDRQHVEEDEL